MTGRIPIVVDNRLRMPIAQLGDDLLKAIKASFTHANPKHHKIKAMGHYPSKKEPATIATWLKQGATLTLPRGGMQRLREVLVEHQQPWQTFDQRTEGDGPRGIPQHNVELWDHQQQVVEAMQRVESGIVRSPTGSGKTSAVLALAAELNLTTLIIVWSKNLLMQWADRIEKELGIPRSRIGIIQGQKRVIAPITLGMQQTLAKGVGSTIAGKFGLVVLDETQRAPAASFTKVVSEFPARYRFGVSDDEKRKDGKEFLAYDLFGPVLHEVDRKEIEDEGLVLPVELRIIPTEFTSERYEKARDQHYCAHDFGVDACIHCGLGRQEESQSPNFHHLLEDLINNVDRERLIGRVVADEIAAGNQALCFSHRVRHCMRLHKRFNCDRHSSGLLVGGDDYAAEFDRTKRGLLDGSVCVAAGTIQAIGQAFDAPRVSRGILCTPITNNKQLLRQVTGRICRRADGKKDAAVYIIHDAVQSDETIKRYLRWYDRVMVHVGGDYATGEYVGAKEWLKNRMQGRLEMTG